MWEKVFEGWKEKLSQLNEQLLDKYQGQDNLSPSKLRTLLVKEGKGEFRHLKKLGEKEIKDYSKGLSILGVDGSVNTVGSTFPHYLTLFQALAKSSKKEEGFVLEKDVHTPLISQERQKMVAQAKEEELPLGMIQEQIKNTRLAKLELEVARKALDKFQPALIIFDGPLWRYQKKAPELWLEFVELILAKGVLLAGVVEEVSSNLLAQMLADHLPEGMQDMFDRELLFGLLAKGEALEFQGRELKEGFLTCFLRPSSDPAVVAFDFLAQQGKELRPLVDFLFTLTPAEGRGVPLWLDIVDKEVRITKQLMDGLLNSTLAPQLKNKLLLPKRLNRIY